MSDVEQIQRSIQSNQQNAQAARNRASQLQGQIAQLQQEIARLEEELRDMRSFKGKAEFDGDEARNQLLGRQRILDQIGELANVRMAAQLAEHITRAQMGEARTILGRGLTDATEEVDRKIRDLQTRIEELRQQLRNLQSQLTNQQQLAVRYDQQARRDADSLRSAQNSAQ